MRQLNIPQIIKVLSAIDIIGINLVLLIAFLLQFYLNELPCPLCILQRIGILGIAFGFLLNVRFKIQPAHYTLSLLSAILTGFIALRQVLLHIVPGTGAYGSSLFGIHLYTWSFIFCVVIIIYTGIVLGIAPQYNDQGEKQTHRGFQALSHSAFLLLLFMTIANVVSTYLICGLSQCPDDPVAYKVFFKDKEE